MRHITSTLFNALQDGILHPLLELVQHDQTLDMELRDKSVNIYYRGGSLFRITEAPSNSFSIFFNSKYCNTIFARLYPKLSTTPSVDEAIQNLPFYKQAMDWWFSDHPKLEREIQQQIVTENNNHGNISYGTDYYIVDIEYADSENNSRFDMVAIKWPSTPNGRRDGKEATLALLELKYGDDSIRGAAGVNKHLKDSEAFLSANENLDDFCNDIAEVFEQKCKLGLINGIKDNRPTITKDNPEIIFIFANHKPASDILKKEVSKLSRSWTVRIATASAMGYGLYSDKMKSVDDFLKDL